MSDQSAKILILDDEKEIREMFKETLEDRGYLCRTAASGEEALEMLEEESVDLLLLDIVMPKMSGLTFFEHAKEQDPDIAVIFITALDDVDLAVRNLKHGAFDYLVKPVPVKRLHKAIEEVLSKRQGLLESRQQQQNAGSQRSVELEQRSRELAALNRLFQKHLKERAAVVEAYRGVLEGLKTLAVNSNTLADLARSKPLAELQQSLEMGLDDELREEAQTLLSGLSG